jgi:hypothetical protein
VAFLSLSPHIHISGQCTPAEEAFRTIAGSGMTIVLFLGVILVIPRRGELASLVRNIAFCFVNIELLGWLLCSFVDAAKTGPNDAAHFLLVSGASPYAVAAVIGFLGAGAIATMFAQPALARVRRLPISTSK